MSERPSYALHLDALKTAIDGKMKELSTTVGLANDGRYPETLAVVRDDAGPGIHG